MAEAKNAELKICRMKDVEKHTATGNLWLVIGGNVYDLSDFTSKHPGGEEILLRNSGSDATNAFEEVGHSDKAVNLMNKYLIGKLDPSEAADSTSHPAGINPGISTKYYSEKGEKKFSADESSFSTKIALSMLFALGSAIYYAYKIS